jgi:hypothetical protein
MIGSLRTRGRYVPGLTNYSTEYVKLLGCIFRATSDPIHFDLKMVKTSTRLYIITTWTTTI